MVYNKRGQGEHSELEGECKVEKINICYTPKKSYTYTVYIYRITFMNTLKQSAKIILEQVKKPLHYKEITRLALEQGLFETT